MKASPRDWNGVAQSKLTNVLGARVAAELTARILRELALDQLQSAEDLQRFAEGLAREGGFAAAVGGLLNVHAAMYGTDDVPTRAAG